MSTILWNIAFSFSLFLVKRAERLAKWTFAQKLNAARRRRR